MKFRPGWIFSTVCFVLWLVLSSASQTASQTSDNKTAITVPVVPPLIHFSNVANDEGGNPLFGKVTMTFSLYTSQRGGEPLWTETRNVEVDSTGHYSVQLGITLPAGVPAALFASGEARWMGVQIGEQPEQPRVLLLSVPYALKAADAQTLGGLPPAAFLRAPTYENGGTIATSGSAKTNASGVSPDLAGSGTVNSLPLWTPDGNTLGSSLLFQNGSGSTGKIGIGNTNPSAKLDVSGGVIVRGALKLPSAGSATAAAGANSQTLNIVASAFNSSASTSVNQSFVWQAVPVNNNTAGPGASLKLLFAQGAATPAATALSIGQSGNLQFDNSQTAITVHSIATSGIGVLAQATATGASSAAAISGVASGDSGSGLVGTALAGSGRGVIAQANGGTGVGLAADAAGASGVGVLASANGQFGKGVVAVGQGASGVGLEGDADNGIAGQFANGSGSNPTLIATNRNAGSIFQAVSGSAKVLDVGATGLSVSTNGATTTVGDVGCDAGFVGIAFGSAVNCGTYSLVGNGATTILNHPTGGRIDFREANNTQMAIAAGGNVGIGTVTPAVLFDVLATVAGPHAPISQFGSTTTTDSNSLRVYNGSGVTEIFAVGKVANFVPGSAVGDGGLRVGPGHSILFGDSGLSRMTIAANGDVHVTGNLSKGGGSFQIDHPLDPKNKYLYHSFVESPDMKNVYDGNITTDKKGMATVVLPDYFEALNRDFRYQLTVIGEFAQVVVAKKIASNQFVIKTNKPGVEVSWQVTGIRQDPYANVHRIPVEQEKEEADRGHYLHPDAYPMDEEKPTVAENSAH